MWQRLLFTGLFLVLGISGQAEPSVSLVGPFGGDVRSLVVHPGKPDRFFLGTADGQIYVSDDAGASWMRLVPGPQKRGVVFDSLVFHPQDPDTLYAACWDTKSNGGWLLRTGDGGQTWEEIPTGSFNGPFRAFAIAPSDPRVIAAGMGEGVLVSLDAGKTWNRITRGYRSLYNVHSLAFDWKDSSTLYVGTFHLSWKTENLGKKWIPMHKGMDYDSDVFSLLVHPLDSSRVFASTCSGVYRSADAGAGWTKLRNGLTKDARRSRTLHIDTANPDILYVGTTIGLFVSHDGGAHWQPLIEEVVINAIAVHPVDNKTILVGTDDAGILKSTDGGRTFQQSNRGFVHRQIGTLVSHPQQSDLVFASVTVDGRYGGLFVSWNGGSSWLAYNDGLGEMESSILAILPSRKSGRLYLGTGGGVYEGTPGSEPWTRIESTAGLRILDMVFSSPQETDLFLAATDGLHRLNLPEQRVTKLRIPVYEGRVTSVLRDPLSNALYAATEIGVFQSRNEGEDWDIKVKGLPPVAVNILKRSGDRLLAGTDKGLYISDDGAMTWSACRNVLPLPITALEADSTEPSRVFAADSTTGHLFESQDGGLTWQVVPLRDLSRVSSLAFSLSGGLLAGTLSEGVYLLQTQPLSTNGR